MCIDLNDALDDAYPKWCCRVPPFLQTIEDPRAAQGGSLKGCPVCGGGFYPLSVSSPSPRRCKLLIFSLQVWVTAFPTAQSSRILSGGRWPLTEPHKTLAGTERLSLLSSCNPISCIVTLIDIALVMPVNRVAGNMDRRHDFIQLCLHAAQERRRSSIHPCTIHL